MKRRPLVVLFVVAGAGLLLLAGLMYVARHLAGSENQTGRARVEVTATSTALPVVVTATPAPTEVPSPRPTPTRLMRDWTWVKPGFSGLDAITLTRDIEQYAYYTWSPNCDAPGRRHIPMIWGRTEFYTNHVALANLFNGLCNDGRPLLFLNEPAKVEQAHISPAEAAHMFYTMTRGADWPYERWHGPIYAGNNVVEERRWDAEFVREFAELNDGSTSIPEIAGWGIHVYANYEYGSEIGDGSVVWTGDIPPREVRPVVYRSMRQVDGYIADRRAEGNSTSLAVTEFGLLQASRWHTPRTFYYETTARFMEEYVRQFDRWPEINAWFWFISTGGPDDFLDTNQAVDGFGALTPNGTMWRRLAVERQR